MMDIVSAIRDCYLGKNSKEATIAKHAADVITALRAELEQFRKDAERYRWLIAKENSYLTERAINSAWEYDLDTYIDAAMEQERGK